MISLFSPFNWLSRALGFNVKKSKDGHLSGEKLRTVLVESGGSLPDENKKMLMHVLDLEKMAVEDIMVPRNDIVGIDLAQPWDAILERLQTSQHTRLPVYKESIDNIIGMVHVRSLMHLATEQNLSKDTVEKITEECLFAPEGTPLHKQLLNFKNEKKRTALVVDEYGDIQGLVTLEDILEEIVGEFTTDIADVGQDIYPQQDGSYIIDGSVTIRELNRSLNWSLPSEGAKTLSGLIIEQVEVIPLGSLCVMLNAYPIEIISIQDNKVKSARVFPRRSAQC